MKKTKIAICYDFDSTLSPIEMQAYGFFDALKVERLDFWKKSDNESKTRIADKTLVNMYMFLEEAKKNNILLTKKQFEEYGKTVELFEGLDSWFDRINEYGNKMGVDVEHYIISSGIKEMILGTSIAKYFKKIYACSYMYDDNGNAIWPAIAINYTNKTQFLYRINKGCLDEYDETINEIMDKDSRVVPFENIIYIGDSFTDIPCMRLVMNKGGYTIGVYNPSGDNKKVKELIRNNKINFIAPADYSKGKTLELLIKEIIKNVKVKDTLKTISKAQKT